jgi:hypothetical protein
VGIYILRIYIAAASYQVHMMIPNMCILHAVSYNTQVVYRTCIYYILNIVPMTTVREHSPVVVVIVSRIVGSCRRRVVVVVREQVSMTISARPCRRSLCRTARILYH